MSIALSNQVVIICKVIPSMSCLIYTSKE